jgi:hypothetical protein
MLLRSFEGIGRRARSDLIDTLAHQPVCADPVPAWPGHRPSISPYTSVRWPFAGQHLELTA